MPSTEPENYSGGSGGGRAIRGAVADCEGDGECGSGGGGGGGGDVVTIHVCDESRGITRGTQGMRRGRAMVVMLQCSTA